MVLECVHGKFSFFVKLHLHDNSFVFDFDVVCSATAQEGWK